MTAEPRKIDIEFTKTYASEENAVKAVSKLLGGKTDADSLRYMVVPVVKEGKIRYGVLFVGMKAIEAGIHFHFNCVN